jgi:hypothetical protein
MFDQGIITMSTTFCNLAQNHEIWDSLREAIANSSGFQRWQEETNFEIELEEKSLDEKVRGYLRSTLETLAY